MTWRWIKRSYRKLIEKALDAVFIFKTPVGFQSTLVIIHGASCSGKSTVLSQLKRRYSGCKFLEADQFRYWVREKKEIYSAISEKLVKSLTDAGIDSKKSKALVESIQDYDSLPGVSSPPYRIMAGMVKECLENDVIIATCGNLPPPHWKGGYYQLLANCTGKGILHVLIAPDKAAYIERVLSRGRETKMERFILSHMWRLENKHEYHLVLTGHEPTTMIIEMIRKSIHAVDVTLHTSACTGEGRGGGE